MSGQPFERAVRDWLEDGSDRTPAPAIDAVLLAVKTTRQERDLRVPRRFDHMPTYMRLAAGIAFVAVVGVGVVAFLNRDPNSVGSPTPALTASPASSPTIPPLREGALDPGQYSYEGDGVRVIVTVPAGWEGGAFSVGTGTELPDGANIGFRQPKRVFGDPCAPEGTPKTLGPAVEDLVAALADLPNITPSPAADVTISGFSGTHISFVVDTTGIDCVMGLYGQDSFIRAADNGQHQELWILDVAGTRLVIDAATYPETSADVRAELQAMVDTLVIQPID